MANMVKSCSLAEARHNAYVDCCTKAGCADSAKSILHKVGVALLTISALGLALALAMKFSPAVANSGFGQVVSQAFSGGVMKYLLPVSATVFAATLTGLFSANVCTARTLQA